MEQIVNSTELPSKYTTPMSQKEWMRVIFRVLTYLAENDPHPGTNLCKEERQILPSSFFTSRSPLQYCYPFKGIFLPSGNLDGRVWKPSQGARPTGDGLMKRYFYFKENGNCKVKRQVIWLTSNENWCFLDYRINFKGKINISAMLTPPGFDFAKLLALIDCVVGIPVEINDTFEKKRKIEDFSSEFADASSVITQLPDEIVAYTSLLQNDIPSSYFLPDIFDVQDVPNLDFDSLDFVRSFEDQIPTELPPILGYLKEEEMTITTKKRRIESEFAEPSTPSSAFSSFSFSAPFDYLLNHILSYDQVLDTICQSISTQLIFNRRFFQKLGLNPYELLYSMKQKCSIVTIDFKEFPCQLIRKCLHWAHDTVLQTPLGNLPQLFCLVCGCSDAEPHDIYSHNAFYGSLDVRLLEKWRTKVHNIYDWTKELISYLLKYPASRLAFTRLAVSWMHCPFCSLKGGKHCAEKHAEWRAWLGVEVPSPVPKEPEDNGNLDSYTKSSFEYLMDRVGFQIPSFLSNLENVQTFLDCLVSLWRCVRLIA